MRIKHGILNYRTSDFEDYFRDRRVSEEKVTEFDMYEIVIRLGLVVFAVIYFTYRGFESGHRLAQLEGALCAICKKQTKQRARMIMRSEKLKKKRKKR